MYRNKFKQQLVNLTQAIYGMDFTGQLEYWLNQHYGTNSETFAQLKRSCEQGVREGWLCKHEAGGIKYGRVFKPDAALHNFSVDVVDMENVIGPHHAHPGGEIDLVMPLTADANFDGVGAGWKVYSPNSAHCPTVTNGRALILYLLPGGEIEFF